MTVREVIAAIDIGRFISWLTIEGARFGSSSVSLSIPMACNLFSALSADAPSVAPRQACAATDKRAISP